MAIQPEIKKTNKMKKIKLFKVCRSGLDVYINPEYIISLEQVENTHFNGTRITVQGAMTSTYLDNRDVEDVLNALNSLNN